MDYLDVEIRSRLGRYLRGEDTLDEFREWFIPATWDVHESSNNAAETLAYRVVHLIGEYSAGELSEARLRSRLKPLIETYVVSYGEDLPGALNRQVRTHLTTKIRNERFSAAGTAL